MMTDEENKQIEELQKRIMGGHTKDEIVQICREQLKQDGYIFIRKTFKRSDGFLLDVAIAEVVNSGEYLLEQSPFSETWLIRKDANYKEKSWADRNPTWDKLLWAILPAILGLIAGLLIARYSTRLESRLNNQQEKKKSVAIDTAQADFTK